MPDTWAVEVNECRIFATAQAAGWWTLYRSRFEPAGRVAVVTSSIGGDRVLIACADRDDADALRAMMVGAGVPAGAVRVRRSRPADN